MSNRAQYVGIDLGTTNSAAAVFDGESVALVRNAQGATLTPSVVRIDARGAVTVGARARRFIETDPENTRSEFKRVMGTSQKLDFPAARLARSPEELSAEVLRSIRRDIEEQFGFSPERAVISVPALFELPQNAATSEAARLAGFERVELLQEPVASALAAGWSTEDSQGTWLVYDLGGGTFDASLLETRDGLLRVVGHDGDNFLGGRDFDNALMDHVLRELSRSADGGLSRSDPRHAVALRKLKLAVEECKIELSRARRAPVSVMALIELAAGPIDVDLEVTRETLEALTEPLISRTLEVCQRLLTAHGVPRGSLTRVVLVGGPTVMPALRKRVSESLGAPFAEGADPMVLVAQGAALYAATAALDARPRVTLAASAAARKVWLQYPAMSSDLTPHVLGRLTQSGRGAAVSHVKITRIDGLWESSELALDAQGAFVATVDLVVRRPNVFSLRAKSADGEELSLDPGSFTIVQGMTLGDPPLSRSVGVALANDGVRTYFERGAPLPARRTFTHRTVETVAARSKDAVLRVPIVQGEYDHAHLCRLVGTLEIPGEGLSAHLPAGSSVEVTLELDRGGRLTARALIPSTGEVFERVAQLMVPDATVESLESSLGALRQRINELRADAFKRRAAGAVEKLNGLERALSEISGDIKAARGGDTDAAQKARRTLLELDAGLEDAELEKRWPELEETLRMEVASSGRWMSQYGSEQEQGMFREAVEAVERARAAKQAHELQRQLRVVKDLGDSAFYRAPEAWPSMFEHAAGRLSEASDLPRAELLVREGRAALSRGDTQGLRRATEALWPLLPSSAATRRLGFDSGVR